MFDRSSPTARLKQEAAMANYDRTSYDEVPYHSYPFYETHPDRLATVAKLFGLNSPHPERCRMLELGCASGGNLLPMAMTLPDSEFVGVDLSAVQVEDGHRKIEKAHCKNLTLRHLSILDVDDSLGKFDYIICHGVYSWVPPNVQEKILDICRKNLSPLGVAYVSYNTYPGWHMMSIIRDLMLYHSERFTEPKMRISQARALLDFLARWVPENNPYGALLKRESEQMRRKSDAYLFHEHLEDVNDPVYFCEFAEAAANKGLQYLGDVHVATMIANDFPNEVREALKVMAPDIINMEQYMDFLRNRQFRKTLLCHKETQLNRNLSSDRIAELHVASSLRATNKQTVDIAATETVEYKTQGNFSMSTPDMLMKACLTVLSQKWPKSVHFRDLLDQTREMCAPHRKEQKTVDADTKELSSRIMTCYLKGLIELHVAPPRIAEGVSERPVASPLARALTNENGSVTNLRHEVKHLAPLHQHLLPALDGTRDRKQLFDYMWELVERRTFVIEEQGKPVTDIDRQKKVLAQMLDGGLKNLLMHSMLVA